MFLRPEKNEKIEIECTVISAPNFHANPEEDGVDNENFSTTNVIAGSISDMDDVMAAKNNSMKNNVAIIVPKSIAPNAMGNV